MQSRFRSAAALWSIVALSGALVLAGCSGGTTLTGKVTGKVTYDGKPVEGGSLTFAPIASGSAAVGKPGSAEIKTDGTYSVGTNRADDGAAIGKHRVSYSPPAATLPAGQELTKEGESMPKSPYDGLKVKQSEVEVKSGANTIDIELVKG